MLRMRATARVLAQRAVHARLLLFAGAECNTVGGAACRRPWTAGGARDELAATLGATAGGEGTRC